MSLFLPLDDNGNVVPAARFRYRGTIRLAVAASSTRNPDPFPEDMRLVSIVATGPCFFEVGDSAVTASADGSPFLMGGQYVDVPLEGSERYIAFVAAAEDCTAYIIGRS